MNKRLTLTLAALSGALAVGIGAFGAHALKPALVASGHLDTYHTAVSYHFYHTFALLATGILMHLNDSRRLSSAAFCFAVGILLFSGSLYVMSVVSVPAQVGMITPFGGLFFIAGWVLLLLAAIKK